jgi:dynactin complex subunit
MILNKLAKSFILTKDETIVKEDVIESNEELKIDSRVEYTQKGAKGSVRYIGKLENDEKDLTWIGVEWDKEGIGKNDGIGFGKRYFQTKPKTGTFIDMKTFKEKFVILKSLKYDIKKKNIIPIYVSVSLLSENYDIDTPFSLQCIRGNIKFNKISLWILQIYERY